MKRKETDDFIYLAARSPQLLSFVSQLYLNDKVEYLETVGVTTMGRENIINQRICNFYRIPINPDVISIHLYFSDKFKLFVVVMMLIIMGNVIGIV